MMFIFVDIRYGVKQYINEFIKTIQSVTFIVLLKKKRFFGSCDFLLIRTSEHDMTQGNFPWHVFFIRPLPL